MALNAETLNQAREAVCNLARHNTILLAQLQEQSQKISDLEREVQRQASIASQARQALINARIENDALRALVPNEATHQAFSDLEQSLSQPAEQSDWQIAA
jgi:hypothetical protein